MQSKRKDYTLPSLMREQWLGALRGDDYKQIDGSFYEAGCGYCALGVAMVECLDIDKSYLEGKATAQSIHEEWSLPYADIKIPWGYGSSDRTVIDTVELEDMIMEMNDGDGMSFCQIAEWIDDNVEPT
tara:strand:+ start:416 stop:799 length:384 start_codon:yes stop_codon:yes gene_type:complete